MTPKKKLGLAIRAVIWAVLASALVLWLVLRAPRPEDAIAGPEAEELAARMGAVVGLDRWAATGAVSWTHAGRNNHLWDRRRGYDRVRFKDGSEVLLDIGQRTGIAFEKGQRVEGDDAEELVEKAYKWWVNDSFWLNPLAKLYDEGVTRARVAELDDEPGCEGLYVTYPSGGVTPGDSYLWIVPADGPPRGWRMWVSVLPVGGLRAAWDGWKRTETGALISTRHDIAGLLQFDLGEVKTASSLAELTGGTDPFAELAKLPAGAPPSDPADGQPAPPSGPSSRPSR